MSKTVGVVRNSQSVGRKGETSKSKHGYSLGTVQSSIEEEKEQHSANI